MRPSNKSTRSGVGDRDPRCAVTGRGAKGEGGLGARRPSRLQVDRLAARLDDGRLALVFFGRAGQPLGVQLLLSR